MVVLDGIQSTLSGILTDELHVYEDSIYAGGLRDLRDVGPVGNIHQFQHGSSLLSRELQGQASFFRVSPTFTLSALEKTFAKVRKKILKSRANDI